MTYSTPKQKHFALAPSVYLTLFMFSSEVVLA